MTVDGRPTARISRRIARGKLADLQLQLGILRLVPHKAQRRAGKLADHRGRGRARHSHGRAAEIAVDHDRVQDDVDQGARQLRRHGEDGVARGLQHALKLDRHENAQAPGGHDAQIGGAQAVDLIRAGKIVRYHEVHAFPGQQRADQEEDQEASQLDQQPVPGCSARAAGILFAQLPADQAVDAHAHAQRQGQHQHLDRVCQGNRRQRVRVVPGDENAVHHIVQRLHQHGNHDRDRYLRDQPPHRHRPQHFRPLVSLHGLFPLYSPQYFSIASRIFGAFHSQLLRSIRPNCSPLPVKLWLSHQTVVMPRARADAT